MTLSKSILHASRTLKLSFAADSVSENLNGGAEGIRAGALMALAMAIMSLVCAIGILRHDLLNGLGANFADEVSDALISSCILVRLILAAG